MKLLTNPHVIHETVGRPLQNEYQGNHYNFHKTELKLYTSRQLFQILCSMIDA